MLRRILLTCSLLASQLSVLAFQQLPLARKTFNMELLPEMSDVIALPGSPCLCFDALSG
jgi:hypothetical protein